MFLIQYEVMDHSDKWVSYILRGNLNQNISVSAQTKMRSEKFSEMHTNTHPYQSIHRC